MVSSKSESFIFSRRSMAGASGDSTSTSFGDIQRCRKKLQNKFDEVDGNERKSGVQDGDRTILSMLSFNSDNTRRMIRNGTQRLTKTFNNVCTTIGSITQRFRVSTKRRQILEEGPMTPSCTPYSRQLLGRTPTKLYSPFGIESPYNKPTTYDKENVPESYQQLIVPK